VVPGYEAGYPSYGYAPYSYGWWPRWGNVYEPGFVVHHPWEEHHAYGHPGSFFHGGGGGGHVGSGGGHVGGGGGSAGHGGGGHAGGEHR